MFVYLFFSILLPIWTFDCSLSTLDDSNSALRIINYHSQNVRASAKFILKIVYLPFLAHRLWCTRHLCRLHSNLQWALCLGSFNANPPAGKTSVEEKMLYSKEELEGESVIAANCWVLLLFCEQSFTLLFIIVDLVFVPITYLFYFVTVLHSVYDLYFVYISCIKNLASCFKTPKMLKFLICFDKEYCKNIQN